MKVWMQFAVVLLLSPTATLAAVYSQLAVGGGYECVVLISNPTPRVWQGVAGFHQGNHAEWLLDFEYGGTAYTQQGGLSLTLGAYSAARMILSGGAGAEIGYFNIQGIEGSHDYEIAVSFFYRFSIDGKVFDSTGVPESDCRTSFALPVEFAGPVNTGLAWSPLFPQEPFDVSLALYDQTGQLVEAKTVPFEGHLARFFTELFTDVPEGFLGTMLVDTPQVNLCVTALRLEQVEGGLQLTAVPPRWFALE